jgi:hypothetical protein
VQREREASRSGDNGEATEKTAVGESAVTTERAAGRRGVGDEGEEAGGGGRGGHERVPLCLAMDAPKGKEREQASRDYRIHTFRIRYLRPLVLSWLGHGLFFFSLSTLFSFVS